MMRQLRKLLALSVLCLVLGTNGAKAKKEAPLASEEAIRELVKVGILAGGPGGLRPNDPITRAEMAAILCRAFGLGRAGRMSSYVDVPANHWAVGVIAAASASGLMGGFPDGTFKPNERLTRAQAIVILSRKALEPGKIAAIRDSLEILSQYSDGDKVGSWARRPVAAAIKYGLLPIWSKLRPNDNATRLDVANMVVKVTSGYTGLVVDCSGVSVWRKGYGASTISTPSGAQIYAMHIWKVAPEWIKARLRRAMVSYTSDLKQAKEFRAGCNPLVVKAIAGQAKGDVVVSEEEGKKILDRDLASQFLLALRVAFIMGPKVVNSIPAPEATDVSPEGLAVRLTFSKEMDRSTLTWKNIQVKDEEGNLVPGNVSYNRKTRVLWFAPVVQFKPETKYTVSLSDSIRGSKCERIGSTDPAYGWWFATGKPCAPVRIVVHSSSSTLPADGSSVCKIFANLQDASGKLCLGTAIPVTFKLAPGSAPVELQGENPANPKQGIAVIEVKAGANVGNVTVIATSPGLDPGRTTIGLSPK